MAAFSLIRRSYPGEVTRNATVKSMNFPNVTTKTTNHPKLPKTTRNHPKPPKTIRNHPKSSATTYPKLSAATKPTRKQLETTRASLKQFIFMQKYADTIKITLRP